MLSDKTLSGKELQDAIKILEVFSDSGVLLYDLRQQYFDAAQNSKRKGAKAEFEKMKVTEMETPPQQERR